MDWDKRRHGAAELHVASHKGLLLNVIRVDRTGEVSGDVMDERDEVIVAFDGPGLTVELAKEIAELAAKKKAG